MKIFRFVGLALMLCSVGLLMAQEVSRTAYGVKLNVPGGNLRCGVEIFGVKCSFILLPSCVS